MGLFAFVGIRRLEAFVYAVYESAEDIEWDKGDCLPCNMMVSCRCLEEEVCGGDDTLMK